MAKIGLPDRLVRLSNKSNGRNRITIGRASLVAQKAEKTYRDLEAEYGVNKWYLWHIIDDPNYIPPAWVQDKLGWQRFAPAPVCVSCGSVHAGNCNPGRQMVDISAVPLSERRFLLADTFQRMMKGR